MGIKKWVKDWLKKRYSADEVDKNAFPSKFELWAKQHDPNWGFVLIVDMMQYMKHKPAEVRTLGDLLAYIMGKVRRKIEMYKGRARVIVLCFDQPATTHKSNVVKQICYKERYKNVTPFPDDGTQYLPKTLDGQLPVEWDRFCCSSNLLRRQLFPLIYNCCLDSQYIQLTFGQRLVMQGLPGLTFEQVPGMKETHLRYLTTGFNDPKSAEALKESQQRLVPWEMQWLPLSMEHEREDPDLYNRVYCVDAVPPGVDHRFPQGFLKTDEWPEALNNVGEADLAMMFFDRFYPDMDQVIDINDGDILPIGLLYAPERIQGNTWRNRQLIQLPIREGNKKKPEEKGEDEETVQIAEAPQLQQRDKPQYTYVDLNVLFSRVSDDPLFGNHGVQNHALTLVLMIILSGTDFFKDSFGGIGVQSTVWKTLTGKLDALHHMVQSTKNIIPDPYALRTVVMDETAWRRFAYWCYVEKHGKTVRKRNKGTLNKKLLEVHLSKRKREAERFPDRNMVRRWGRQVLWNLEYWLNGPRYKRDPKSGRALNFPDPFLRINDEAFYGYELDLSNDTLRFSLRVSARSRPVDDVYAQHFIKPHINAPARKKRRMKQQQHRIPSDQQMDSLERAASAAFEK